ncbi:MAG: CxxC-x17-CxxC domain-containing protein, partial [Ruthenibacterium sp.]
TATCASCGCEAKVPFEPRNDRPVYCSDCFAKMKA